jgi:valyl-tRNA synthetase
VLTGEEPYEKAETQATAAWALDQILKLLHPFMPFVTEELWAETGKTGPARERQLVITEWPDLSGIGDPKADAEMEWLIGVVSAIRSVRTEMNVPAGAKIPLVIVGAGEESGERVEGQLAALTRLARLSDVSYSGDVPGDSAQVVIGEANFVLPLKGVIDIDAERVRLKRELAKEEVEVAKIDKKLGNEQFVAKAPPVVIEEQHERRAEAMARIERLKAALERLS